MRIVRYHDIVEFSGDVMELLLEDEAVNNLPIGIIDRGLSGAGDPADWFMATAAEGEEIHLIALMTPPHNIIITATSHIRGEAAYTALVGELISGGVSVPGAIGEGKAVGAFAEKYCAAAGMTMRVSCDERAYKLTEMNEVREFGTLRPEREEDMHYLPYWIKGFHEDCFGGVAELNADGIRASLGNRYILEVDGQPVSLAGSTRRMPHGRSIGPVYTPPYFRGAGYATSCVAQLSRKILSEGYDYCVLFADLANPVSNAVYIKIGYQPICDWAELKFERAQERG